MGVRNIAGSDKSAFKNKVSNEDEDDNPENEEKLPDVKYVQE